MKRQALQSCSCLFLLFSFLILTAYSIRASFVAIDELAAEVLGGLGGTLESGELLLREQGGGRVLSTSLFSRWSR